MNDFDWINQYASVIERYEHRLITRADAYVELTALGFSSPQINGILAYVKPVECAA